MVNSTSTEKSHPVKNIYALTVAAAAWVSIGLQFYITDLSALNFFSYFTTLCNLLIASCLTFSTVSPASTIGAFFSKLSVQSAVATYIFIVSLVYNLVLRGIWVLTGLPWVLDNMVHVVVPVLYLIYWILFRPRGVLKWADGFYWVIFPLCYLIYSLIRGSIIQWYPYPFLNAIKYGYVQVFLNIGLMALVFIVAGLVLVMITRRLNKR